MVSLWHFSDHCGYNSFFRAKSGRVTIPYKLALYLSF